ncbi:MAG: MHYT domain-containing protein [Pseudomonadota bacterium]
MHSGHPSLFVLLSVVVAVLGSWTALDLFARVRSHIGRARWNWLAAAGAAMGLSIWSMHFIAMLGFDPGGPVAYDPALTGLSLFLAMGATCGAFFAAAREGAGPNTQLIAAGAMGSGICAMHYVGMAALHTAVALGYRPPFVVASFLIAVAASLAALWAARRRRSLGWRALAALVLGLAIVGMHYTAMAGLTLTPIPGATPAPAGAPPLVLGAGVAAATLALLFLALTISLYDRRLNVLSALEAARIGYWELTLPDFTLHVSGPGRVIFGGRADAPFTRADFQARLSATELARSQDLLGRAIASGADYDAEYELSAPERGAWWINVRGRVVDWSQGRPRRMAGVVLDVTERRQAFHDLAAAERRQRMLIDELNHRVKNTLATVQSIARQTAKGSNTSPEFREAFEARLVALSRTHNVLTRHAWEQADLKDLLAQEFAPHPTQQFRCEGPSVSLTPRQTLGLGMMLHELTTNAVKYGALAAPGGVIALTWRIEDRDLVLEWRETGGPPVMAGPKAGFGTRLITALARDELHGQVVYGFEPGGVVCRVRLPLAQAPDLVPDTLA